MRAGMALPVDVALGPGPGQQADVLAGRPQLIRGRSRLLFRGMRRLSENSMVVIKNRSHAITAQVVAPRAALTG